MPTLADYLALVPSQHAVRPRFMATLAAVLQPFVDEQAMLAAMPEAFDLDTAVGVQLDAVGQWVGRSRIVTIPLDGVFFSWGIAGLGWNQGFWRGPYDPVEGLTSLDDDTYRTLLRAKIAANNWDGTMQGAVAALALLFQPGQEVFLQDNGDMSITYAVSGAKLSPIEYALFAGGYLPLKLAGVRIEEVVQTSVAGTPVFGWGADNNLIGGWGRGSWASRSANPY